MLQEIISAMQPKIRLLRLTIIAAKLWQSERKGSPR
jgi:hypothetical protein